jgi:hypothetical protein
MWKKLCFHTEALSDELTLQQMLLGNGKYDKYMNRKMVRVWMTVVIPILVYYTAIYLEEQKNHKTPQTICSLPAEV